MKVKYTFVKREIGGESFLVPVGEALKEFCGLFALSEVGSFIWDRLEQDEETIAEEIVGEYDVSYEKALADVREFTETLRKTGMVE
ncbi:MAG: PqqD family protein [Clostridia bacterium]|nr:PqqD family protein [Clostridia bacterium]